MKTYHQNRTTSYLFSVNNDAEGHAHIANIRNQISIENAEQRIAARKCSSYTPVISKIAVCGRLGKNNPNAMKYRSPSKTYRDSFFCNRYQNIAHCDAATLDIYQYVRL